MWWTGASLRSTAEGDIDASKLVAARGDPELMKGGGVLQEAELPGVTLSEGHVKDSSDGKVVVVRLLESA